MKEDAAIHDKLKRIETATLSMPPIVDGVMAHVRHMPTPVPRRFTSRQLVAMACTVAGACLAAVVGVWMVGGEREPVDVASISDGQHAYPRGEEPPELPATQTYEPARGEEVEGSGEVAGDYGQHVESVPILPQWLSSGRAPQGEPLPSIQVARSSAIAICTIVEMPKEGKEGRGVCKVERVIYGRLPQQRIRLYLTHARLGATRVFYLTAIPPGADAEVDYSVYGFGPIDVGNVREHEEEVVEIVKDGDHLTPPDLSGYHLGMYIRASARIVRAKLKKVDKSEAEWSVLDELEFEPFPKADVKGMQGVAPAVADATAGQGPHGAEPPALAREPRPTKPRVVRVGLMTWRLRAETVAGNHAAHEPEVAVVMDGPEGGPVTGPEVSVAGQVDVHESSGRPTEKEIQQAFDRLVTDELKPGTEAILLLRPGQRAGTYNVVGNFFADPESPGHLERAWNTVKKIVDSGEYKDTADH
jgi:hypothetical protein